MPHGRPGSTYGGLSGKSKSDFDGGNAYYVPFMSVMEKAAPAISALPRVQVGEAEQQNQVRAGDLLFNGSSETPDELALAAVVPSVPDNTCLNSFCIGFRIHPSAKANPLFLAYLFRSGVGRSLLRSLAQGATRYNLSKAQFKELRSTPALDEQIEIAGVLADMDAELEVLAARLAKSCDIKQGMMQELLTGRMRLPVSETAEEVAA